MTVLSEEIIKLNPRIMAQRRHPVANRQSRSTKHLHVMQIVTRLAIAAGKLDEILDWEPFTETHYPTLPAMGVMWEEFRASYFNPDAFCWQPGEHLKDGIAGNPDGVFPFERKLWECKATTKKPQPVAEIWIYVKQILCYLKLTGMTQALLEVLWIAGDRSKPIKPIATSTLLEFTQHEIDSWWAVMVKTAREMEARNAIA